MVNRAQRCLLLLAVILAGGPGRAAEPSGGWRLRFDASLPDLTDKARLTIGSGTEALAGLDDFDEPHPPGLPSRFLDAYVEHQQGEAGWSTQLRPLTRYRQEYGPALGAASRAYEFFVDTDQTGLATLTWEMATDLDLVRHFLTLRDLESGASVDMWAGSVYPFVASGTRRRFRVEMTPGRSAPPLAYPQTASVAEDGTIALTLAAEDPEGDPLTYEIVGAPAHGALAGMGSSVTYTPAANYFGADSFTFLARDSQGPSNVAVVSLVVTPVNDAPSALPQTLTTNEDEPLALTLLAADPDGDALTYAIVQPPSNGTLEGAPPSLTYRPRANFGGSDSFAFTVSDSLVLSTPATVSLAVVSVNDPPRAAFTVPGEAANVAVWDNNIGSSYEGASASASSQAAGAPASYAIDDNLNTRWTSASGAAPGQSLTVALPRGLKHPVVGVRLVNAATTTEAIKHFEVRVSATTSEPSAFTTVLTDLALSDGRIQEFMFPAPLEARFVQLRALDNYGSASAVSVVSFEVIGEGLGGVPSYMFTPGNLAAASDGGRVVSATSQNGTEVPARAIDGIGATLWTSASGQRANQALVVELAREKTYSIDRVRIVNGAATAGQAMKNFTVSVSSTTSDPSAFVDVLSAAALNNSTLQEFVFPGGAVAARFVRLNAADNYGSTCCISLGELQVVPAQNDQGSVSSGNAASERAENVLDASLTNGWRTAAGQVTNQSLTIRLQAGRDHLIDRVRLVANGGTSSLRDFSVLVSATTDAEAAFVPVLSGTLANSTQLQEFLLPGGPVRARYVKLLARSNYGGASIFVSAFQVITAQTAGSLVSIPAPFAQLARNESPALIANGALVLAFSSAYPGTAPSQMLDYVQDNPWATNGLTGQFALIRLAKRSLLNGVRVSPRLDCCPTQSVKDFEIWTSDTTAADEAFTRAYAGTVQNDGGLQAFSFTAPIMARYLKYVPLSGYGDPLIMSTTRFDVIAAGAGGVMGASSGPLANLPELALDGSTATAWRTSAGAISSQWINVSLAGDTIHRVFGARVSPEPNTGPRGFEIRVSTTTATEGDFVTVASGTLTAADASQEIAFAPVDARYVQFRWLSGYGPTFIGVREIEVLGGIDAGAVVRGVSSQSSPAAGASQILDADTVNGAWTTAPGQAVDQWLTLTLPGDSPIAIDRVALQGQAATPSPKEFEVQVSTTNADPGAFTTAFAGTLRDDGTLQNYFFDAVPARHLRLLIKTNYGGSSITAQNFKVFSPEFGETQARFSDQSTAIDGQLTGRTWDFGDGALGMEPDPAHAYPAAGVYAVRLTAAADTGLTSELVRPYRAAARPVPEFDFYPATPREGQSVAFSDGTTDPSGIVLREWDFGDGVKAATSAGSVSHAFVDNGTFTVTLKVTNSFGLVASTARQVLVANVAPTVKAGENRRWVAGESIAFAPTVTDPGADPPTCSWDFGDGTTASTCFTTHTYLRPSEPTDDPIVFTAVLTVNDGDGGVTSSSVDTHVFPQRLKILSAGLTNPIGIDWRADSGRFVVANRYPSDQLVTVLPDGTVSPALVANLGSDEVNLVVSPGLGGFARGDVYYNVGRNRQVGRLKMDPAGNVTQVESPWVTQLSAATYGGITFDTQGGFGYDLLVVWQHGVIYRVNAAGQSTEIARLSGGEFEGATVAGPNFGPASGCLLTVVRLPGKVWAVCPTGAPFIVADMSSLTQNQISWIRYVPAPGSLMFTDYQFGRVLRGDPRVFGADIAGHAVISSEYAGEVWDLYYDASGGGFKTRLMALAPNAAAARLEDITYVPAHGQLAPGAAAVETGNPHSVSATVADEAGFAVAGLPVAFVVTGANPRTAEVSTDANGVATFSYVGVSAGDDYITASSFGLVTNAVTVTWSGNVPPTAHAQSVTTSMGVPASVILTGVDPEGATLSYAITGSPQHGTLSGAAPTLTYTPAPGYVGTDSFTFTVIDPVGATSPPATVSIMVIPLNTAPTATSQSITMDEDAATPITLTGADPENEALTFAIVIPPSHGTLAGTAPSLTYTPAANFDGPDSFTFTVTDPSGATSAPAAVEITVTPVNDGPTALGQALTIPEDTPAAIVLGGSDPDGDSLAYVVVAPPQYGILAGAAPDLTYVPNANYNGTDMFAFVVVDPSGWASAPANVFITTMFVNDAPVANSESTTTSEGVPLEITLTADDIENDALTFTVVTPPRHGTLAGTAPNLTYTPSPGYSGPDSLTFQVADAPGAMSLVATISIEVKPATVNNQPPVCSTATVPRLVWPPNHEMTPLSILGVTDPEGGNVTIAVTSIRQDEPLNGTGDGDASPDATLSPPAIRAERRQNGNGRVYTVDFKALDPLGGSCLGVVKVCVPKSQSGKGSTCVDDGPVVDSTGGVQ